MRQAFLLVMFSLLSSCLLAIDKNFGRDPEAIYLEDLTGLGEVLITPRVNTGIYARRNLQIFLANLLKNQKAILLAYNKDSYYVQIPNKNTKGWVDPDDLEPLDKELIIQIAEKYENYKKFESALAEKRVIPGMTLVQVKKMLGKPDKESFRVEASGRYDSYSYITYEKKVRYQKVRDPFSNRLITTSYVEKIPVGSLNIQFKEGEVVSLEQTVDNNRKTDHRFN
ncbi:MAG: hypothetical protein AAGA18_02230 [Verrucomicrobiota bacterium]